MEIKKIICLLFVVFLSLSCSKSAVQETQDQVVTSADKLQNKEFRQISYINKYMYEGRVNVFEFKDHQVTIEYLNETLFGIGADQKFSIYKTAFDLDLGELDLLRFDNFEAQIYLVELNEGGNSIFNIYLFKEEKIYYLGDLDFDLSVSQSNELALVNKFSIQLSNEEVEIEIVNGTTQVSKKFKITKPLVPAKSFKELQNYLDGKSTKELAGSQFSKEYKSDFFQLGISEDLLSVKVKGSAKEHLNESVLEGYSSCPDTSLDDVVIKDQYFTLEKYNCNNDFYLKEYITFKYTNELLLHKYSVEYTSRRDPDADIKTDHFTTKDFGKVKFENVNKNFLNNLRQK